MKSLVIVLLILLADLTQSTAQKIASGDSHVIYVCADSSVSGYGKNTYGELGDSTILDRNAPVQVYGMTNVIAVAAGWHHSLAVKSDGTVWTWGFNNEYELGYSTPNWYSIIPMQVPGLNNVIGVAGSETFSVALKSDGTVWAWGKNTYGELGNNSYGSILYAPTQINGLSNIIQITAGWYSIHALRADGTVWGLGRNSLGTLGDSTMNDSYIPVQAVGVSDVVSISAGTFHVIALKSDGTLLGWGNDADGEILVTGGGSYYTAVVIPGKTDILSIGTGYSASYAVDYYGVVYWWGANITQFIRVVTGAVEVGGGAQHAFALKADGSIWGCGNNGHGQAGVGSPYSNISTPEQVLTTCQVNGPQGLFPNYVHGKLFIDKNSDCIYQSDEFPIPNILLKVTPGNLYVRTDRAGNYSFGFRAPGTYTLIPVIPSDLSYLFTSYCPQSITVASTFNFPADTTGFDFAVHEDSCFHLEVSIVEGGRRQRRCFRNLLYLNYQNKGLTTAYNVQIHLNLSENNLLLGASQPYMIDPADSSIIFNIDSVIPFQSGSITVTDSVKCIPNILGLVACQSAWILPVNYCFEDSTTGPNWDHSSVYVDGQCHNDTNIFTIVNTGTSDMTAPSNYRIYFNNVLTFTGTFQLVAGDSLVIPVVSNGATVRFEADQPAGHPGNSIPQAWLEGCGTDSTGSFSTGYVTQVPFDDPDPDVEITCSEIRDSFDPNEKIVSPSGIGIDHVVLPDATLEYIIHFQNTGNDTAYRVIVVDTLSDLFDFSTLEFGASSHPYTIEMNRSDKFVLKFIFNSINLLDSVHDELNSHGSLSFKIRPVINLPLTTVITNSADIYFDYNVPVRTNESFVTLGQYSSTVSIDKISGQNNSVICFPNPFTSSINVVSTPENRFENISVTSIDGKLIQENTYKKADRVSLNLSNLSTGIYFLKCRMENSTVVIRILKE